MAINKKVISKNGLVQVWKVIVLGLSIVFLSLGFSCVQSKENAKDHEPSVLVAAPDTSSNQAIAPWVLAFRESKLKHATHFEMPVGEGGNSAPKGYYNAQGFGENQHLGDDWNGTGGGNSDLGDPVYAAATGWVRRADDLKGGWGKVIRIVHLMVEDQDSSYVESIYAHLNEMNVEAGTFVNQGEKIGSIGNADGAYWAHLHLEIRKEAGLPIGGGYSSDSSMHYNPSQFIRNH